MSGEHHRDEHARDLVVAVASHARLVSESVKDLEQVRVFTAVAFAPLEDGFDSGHEFAACAVAGAQGRDRQVRVHVGECIGPALEVHEEFGDLGSEFVAELRTDQACTRGVESEL